MTERINARIDGELAAKVEYLKRATRRTTTEVVRDSIEAYHRQVIAGLGPVALLADFIASGEAAADLSSSYKEELTKALTRKHR